MPCRTAAQDIIQQTRPTNPASRPDLGFMLSRVSSNECISGILRGSTGWARPELK